MNRCCAAVLVGGARIPTSPTAAQTTSSGLRLQKGLQRSTVVSNALGPGPASLPMLMATVPTNSLLVGRPSLIALPMINELSSTALPCGWTSKASDL